MTRKLKVLLGISALTLAAIATYSPVGLVTRLPAFGVAPAPLPAPGQSGLAERAGGMPGHVAIPSLGVYATVVNAPRTSDSWNVSHLGWKAGHLEGTAYPGQGGNVVLGAHRYLYVSGGAPSHPGPFATIDRLQPGDRIEVTAGGNVYVYAVTGQLRVARDEVWVVGPTDHEVLTLLSCDTWNPKTLRFDKRLVIRADLVEVV